ncbi:hypothetical protein [Paracoccus sp. (in: a-proteobacteria)]|uniref:hypothetical protein n=1 Tax=Paracoccus sp. TaxID=267 RepID=UPI00258B37B6|nr:hypothetical protein [Paracoccus sp. (in: a-proteobacteria)]
MAIEERVAESEASLSIVPLRHRADDIPFESERQTIATSPTKSQLLANSPSSGTAGEAEWQQSS